MHSDEIKQIRPLSGELLENPLKIQTFEPLTNYYLDDYVIYLLQAKQIVDKWKKEGMR